MKDGFQGKISNEISIYPCLLHQVQGMPVRELIHRYPQLSRASICRHAKKIPRIVNNTDIRKSNRGRPKKVTERDERSIVRTLYNILLQGDLNMAPL